MKTYNSDWYLIFGGTYSNFPATVRLKEIADKLNFTSDRIICTGDVVGYCSKPEETLQFVKNWGVKVLAGNVEENIREGEMDCGCNFDEGSICDLLSKQWFPFAQQNLSEESVEWMHTLKTSEVFKINDKKVGLIHGGLEDISEFIFNSTPVSRKLEIMSEMDVDVILAGHCGLPFSQKIDDKTWINPGVVGMPANDGTTRVWFALWNSVTNEIEHHSFNYNHQEAAKGMVENALPKEYSFTLYTGKWDNNDILPDVETDLQGVNIKSDCHWEIES